MDKAINSSKKPKFNKFRSKTGPLQILSLIIQILCIVICIIIIISVFILTLPQVELNAISIPQNPRKTIDLKELPNLKINMSVIGYISNRNLIPLPISFFVEASIDSEDPADRTIFGSIQNTVLMPLNKKSVSVPVTGNINLFESKTRTLSIVMDACGVTSEEEGRAPLKFNIYANAYLGYGILSIFLKTLNYKIELPCPFIEPKFSTVVLGGLNDLLF